MNKKVLLINIICMLMMVVFAQLGYADTFADNISKFVKGSLVFYSRVIGAAIVLLGLMGWGWNNWRGNGDAMGSFFKVIVSGIVVFGAGYIVDFLFTNFGSSDISVLSK